MSTLFAAVQITSANFDQILSDTFLGATAVRDRIQDLSIFALLHFAGTPNEGTKWDTSKLTAIKVKMTSTKGLNHTQWVEWVQSVAGVGVGKSGSFTKEGEGEVSPIALDTKWYEHGRTKDPQKSDLNKAVTKIINALESGDLSAVKVDMDMLVPALEKALRLAKGQTSTDAAAHARKEEDAKKASAAAKKASAAAKRRATIAKKKLETAEKIELPAVPELKAA